MNLSRHNFAPVWKYLKPHKKILFVAAFFVILENGIQLALPIFYGKAIDGVVESKVFSMSVIRLIAIWFVLNLLSSWFMRMRVKRGTLLGYTVAADMFTKLINQFVRMPLTFHREVKTGEMIERFDRADFSLDRIINEGLLQSVPHLITSILAFGVILWIKWELALVYLLFITVFLFLTLAKIKPIISFNRKINNLYQKVYGSIFERTPNVQTIKANSSEDKEYKRNRKEYANIYDDISDYTDLWMNLQFWQDVVFATGFLLLFLVGLWFVRTGLVSVGEFVMLLAYIGTASASIQHLGVQYKEIQEGLVVIESAEKIFKKDAELYDDPDAVSMPNFKGRIEFKKVSFSHKNKRVFKEISFIVKPGQMVAIVGGSGQGKTTLVDMIPRFFKPSSGKILIDGVDVEKIKLQDLRKQIGIVSQDSGLFHDSIKNNIRYSRPSAKDSEVFGAGRIAHCHDFVHSFAKGYSTSVGDRGLKLSAGQRQRIAIARAILRNPKILILDEATSSLDSESERVIQEAMDKIMKDRTTVVVAHRLSTIRKADLILVLEDGKIVERGNHAELLHHGGVYKKLHELQHVSV
jgi:ABC-type multidrug transport system fused ATPase/permease subunit